MNNLKRKWASDYTVVSNVLVNCFGLHPMTRFLCIYLSAQADSFQFNNAVLCKALDCKDATLRKYMKEAIEYGLIERTRKIVSGKFGYFDYELIDPTTLQNLPHGKKTKVEKNQGGKNVRLNKEEISNKEEKNNKEERGAREFSLPVNSSPVQTKPVAAAVSLEDKYPDPADKAEAIYQRCIDTLKANTMLFPVVIKQANINITKEQFAGELRKWVEYYIHDSKFFKDAHKRINYGRGSFKSWLSSDKTRDQYAKLNAATVSKVLKGKSPFEQLRELRAKQTA